MRTIKLKLPFANNTGIADRHSKLFLWAKTLVNNATVNVLDEQHFESASYIVVENTYKPTPESEKGPPKGGGDSLKEPRIEFRGFFLCPNAKT